MNKKRKIKSKFSKIKSESKKGRIFEGVVDMTNSGNAFVIVKELKKDILVLAHNVADANNKDIVKVRELKESQGRIYGEIIAVIKKAQNQLLGEIIIENNLHRFRPMDKYRIRQLFDIENLIDYPNIKNDTPVFVELIPNTKDKIKIVSIVDTKNQDQFILNDILLGYDFKLNFPDEVLEYCNKLTNNFTDEIKHRCDFRNVLTFTIDPTDAKDFDDALSFQILPNGNIQIGIHIADVSHFVQPHSLLNDEAYSRATSVYMPGFVSPMLPEHLSNNLCSLVPNQDRLTFATIVELQLRHHKIEFVNVEFAKTIIHSDKRFTYDDVQTIIETGKGEYQNEILQLHNIATQLRTERIANGAIKFASVELKFVLDDNNYPIDITIKENKEANHLVEEFMLLANKEVAKFLNKFKDQNIYFPFRVHDLPDEQKVATFNEYIKRLSFKVNLLNPKTFIQELNKFLDDLRHKPELSYLEKLAIRSMAKAQYTTNNIGHYGLGFDFYCHFTSPIRRYPDILTHRALFNALEKKIVTTTQQDIEINCNYCNQKEKDAVEAERVAIKYRQVQFMSKYVGQEFDAVITGIASFGMWAETIQHKCEGMIKMADLLLIDDFYFQQEEYRLVGKRTKKILTMGQHIRIQVVAANINNKELDFNLIEVIKN